MSHYGFHAESESVLSPIDSGRRASPEIGVGTSRTRVAGIDRAWREKRTARQLLEKIVIYGLSAMPYFEFIWTDKIIEHIAEHGISKEDFQEVVCHATRQGNSQSSGLPAAWGFTLDGRYVFAVYEELDDLTLLPVTAFEIREPN